MKFLDLPKENISTIQLLGLIFLAYAFSFVIRLIWVLQFGDFAPYHFDGELMINTNDGYFFASGAQEALFGVHDSNPRSPNWLSYGVTFFTVIFTKFTPFSLETIILYMPTIVSSLVVIPMILISRLFNATLWGFFAALLGSIAWSYYNRTMTGYYDSDMFAAMAPMFVLYFFIASIQNFTLKSALYAGLMIVIYPFLYDQGRAVVFAMSIIYFIYLLFYHRDEKNTYKSIVLISLSTLPLYLFVPTPYSYVANAILLLFAYLFLQKRDFQMKQLYMISAISVVSFLYFGNVFSLIIGKVVYYLSRSTDSDGLHFFQVNQTIREAGKIPFSTMANRISGSTIGVIFSLIGYVLLVVRYRPFILALPLIGIGVFSLVGGLRFTVFAVSIASMSGVYLFYVISNFSDKKVFNYAITMSLTLAIVYPNIIHLGWSIMGFIVSVIGYVLLVVRYRPLILTLPLIIGIGVFSFTGGLRSTVFAVFITGISAVYLFYIISDFSNKKALKYGVITLLTLAMIYPNIIHIIGYRVPTVFMNEEVKILKKLDEISSDKDYTLTWWDYGYPIWYYSDTNTLIDGGKHGHDNYIIAKILNSSSQTLSANLARLSVETYKSSGYELVADTLFTGKNPNDILDKLEADSYKLPAKSSDIFIYLPNRLLNIFPTVGLFSNIDLLTGQKGGQKFFYKADRFKDDGKLIHFGNGITLDKQTSILKFGPQKTTINKFVLVSSDQNGKINKKVQTLDPDSDISVIFMQSYNSFLILDKSIYDSLFIKLFVLEEYEKDLFELVITNPYAKVYKLKI